MGPLTSALGVLSAMITPAVLISACGTLILSTSNRLSRVVDRVHGWSEQFEATLREEGGDDLATEHRATIFDQLDATTERVRLLQRGMTAFYVALGIVVAISIAIGIVAVTDLGVARLPIGLGLAGALALLYGTILLIAEARLARYTTYRETEFVRRLSRSHAPEDLLRAHRPRRAWRSRES